MTLDSFGNPATHSTTTPAALDLYFSYTGKYRDPLTGEQYNNARRFDPATGRFLSHDPIEADANSYRYAGNDPVNKSDPSGLVENGPNRTANSFEKESPILFNRTNHLSSSDYYQAPEEPLPTKLSTQIDNQGREYDKWSDGMVYGGSLYERGSLDKYGNFVADGVTMSYLGHPVNHCESGAGAAYTEGLYSSIYDQTVDAGGNIGGGLHALIFVPESRSEFGKQWKETRVDPLASRLTVAAYGYGSSTHEIGDENSLALFRPVMGEVLAVLAAAEAIDGRDISGVRINDEERTQRGLFAFSTFVGLVAGGTLGMSKAFPNLGAKMYPIAPLGPSPKACNCENPNVTARLEANAARRLAEIQADAGPKSHFFSRHGAQTTIEEQFIRSTEGITPDGKNSFPVDSSRFLSHRAQLNAVQFEPSSAVECSSGCSGNLSEDGIERIYIRFRL